MKDPTDAMGDVLTPASRVVSAERHRVLLEHVAKLERAHESVADVLDRGIPDERKLATINRITHEALSD
jgi:hypothetical protein